MTLATKLQTVIVANFCKIVYPPQITDDLGTKLPYLIINCHVYIRQDDCNNEQPQNKIMVPQKPFYNQITDDFGNKTTDCYSSKFLQNCLLSTNY